MKKTLIAAIAMAVAASPAAAQEQSSDQYRAEARALAERSGFTVTYDLQCRTGGGMPPGLFAPGAPPPTKLFDNLYYVGLKSVGAYVVKTSAGLILLDSLNSTDDVRNTIEPGMKALGLDPAQIKYVVVSHGHGDHYGGARYIADTYKAHVIMSAADWDFMNRPMPVVPGRPAPHWGPPPSRDMVATDGQKLTLGDTTITLVLTPGHTPGTLSFIVPLKDHGVSHTLAMWGGTGVPNTASAHTAYLNSIDHFADYTATAHADVELSNHPFVDDSLTRMDQLRNNPTEPNPFVIGEARYADYTGILKRCALSQPATAPDPATAAVPGRP